MHTTAPVIASLTAEWEHRLDDPTAASPLPEFPSLRGLIAHLSNADYDEIDRIFHALLTLSVAGDTEARTVLMHRMLGALVNVGSHLARQLDGDLEEAMAITLAAFWSVAADFPVDRRTSRLASSLRWDTLARARKTLDPAHQPPAEPVAPGTDRPLVDARWADLERTLEAEQVADPNPEAEVWELMAWALDTGVITRDEAQLLLWVYTGKHADIWNPPQLTDCARRQRCSRLVRRIAAAASSATA